jgi:hypothetical protein
VTAFPDFSDLRDARAGQPIVIPLNGQTYHAIADPPADLVLAATGLQELPVELMAKHDADPDSLTPAERIAMMSASGSSTRRMMAFFDQVLEPDSAERWAAAMKGPQQGMTPAKRRDAAKAKITLEQVKAVYQHLIRVYSGGTPTEAPSSSNGHGANGPTSTAGAPSEG